MEYCGLFEEDLDNRNIEADAPFAPDELRRRPHRCQSGMEPYHAPEEAPAEHPKTSLAPRTRSPKRLEPQNRVHKGSPWHKLKRLWKKKRWSRNRSRDCNRCQDT